MFWWKTHLLKLEQLKVLDAHKYSVRGSSILEPIFQRFWCSLVPYIPKNIAPNTLTLSGLIVNAVSVGIIFCYSSDLKTEIPRWALLFGAVSVFIYQTLDALDGKHARQTNTSSPLGELFDHGCDAVASVFVPLMMVAAIGLGDYPLIIFFQFFIFISLYYIAHWQCYICGFLEFGKVDVTEGQVGVILILLTSAIFGVKFWDNCIPVIGIPFKFLTTFVMTGSGICNINRFLSVVLKGGAGKSGTTVANTSVLFPIFPFGLVLLNAMLVAFRSPMSLYSNHILLFLMSFGFVACKIIIKLVVNHMCKSEMTLFDSVLVGPFLLLLNQYFNCTIPEVFVLWCCGLWTIADLIIYSQNICVQIADHLNIYIFRVDKPPPKVKSDPQSSTSTSRPRTQWKHKNNQFS